MPIRARGDGGILDQGTEFCARPMDQASASEPEIPGSSPAGVMVPDQESPCANSESPPTLAQPNVFSAVFEGLSGVMCIVFVPT